MIIVSPRRTHPDATNAPSSWKASAYTSLLCPSCTSNSDCVATSHNRQVPSNDDEPRYAPEGWNATRPIRFECPDNVASGLSLQYRQPLLDRHQAMLTHPRTTA